MERISPDLQGQVFSGRYRVLSCIGQGALGSVHVVEHVHVGRRFAMKVLRQEHCDSKNIVERFRQEAKLGGRLQSPYTVQVIDYDTWRGMPYLVMEYLEGESLHALLLREGPLPALRAARLLADACRGVSAAHALGVLHRDLKPSNLFVCRNGDQEQCRVLDFGVAKVSETAIATSVAPSTSTGAIVGTLAYMAPEQIRADIAADARADVYALGAILYECLAGVRAFDAPTPPTLMYKILEEQPRRLSELRPELPRAVADCVHRALERDPDARFQSAAELQLALERLGDTPQASSAVGSDDTEVGSQRSPVLALPREAERSGATSPRPSWAASLGMSLCAGALGTVLGLGVHSQTASRGQPDALPQLATHIQAIEPQTAALPEPAAPQPGLEAPPAPPLAEGARDRSEPAPDLRTAVAPPAEVESAVSLPDARPPKPTRARLQPPPPPVSASSRAATAHSPSVAAQAASVAAQAPSVTPHVRAPAEQKPAAQEPTARDFVRSNPYRAP